MVTAEVPFGLYRENPRASPSKVTHDTVVPTITSLSCFEFSVSALAVECSPKTAKVAAAIKPNSLIISSPRLKFPEVQARLIVMLAVIGGGRASKNLTLEIRKLAQIYGF